MSHVLTLLPNQVSPPTDLSAQAYSMRWDLDILVLAVHLPTLMLNIQLHQHIAMEHMWRCPILPEWGSGSRLRKLHILSFSSMYMQ